ncbi:MAG: hypothetical protein IPM55_12640 [Acidobacteria bacterium]|nr:hypothetical protein [Acidobacteriota bacterium]
MSEAMKSINQTIGSGGAATTGMGWRGLSIMSYLPAILPLVGAALMVTARIKMGAGVVPEDGTLVVLALLCYIISAASLVTNFWAPIKFCSDWDFTWHRSASSSTCRAGWCAG